MNHQVSVLIHAGEHGGDLVVDVTQPVVRIGKNFAHPVYRSYIGFGVQPKRGIGANCIGDHPSAISVRTASCQGRRQRIISAEPI